MENKEITLIRIETNKTYKFENSQNAFNFIISRINKSDLKNITNSLLNQIMNDIENKGIICISENKKFQSL